ncbi:hypothetical protein NAH39_11950, partial [Francisella tularensis subsp. holarctica]
SSSRFGINNNTVTPVIMPIKATITYATCHPTISDKDVVKGIPRRLASVNQANIKAIACYSLRGSALRIATTVPTPNN